MMKKFIVLLIFVILLTGCGKKNDESVVGRSTDFSKKYLTKGYVVNVYRSAVPLSDEIEDMGKGNVKMIFQILVDYDTTIDFHSEDEYIKKQTVSNVKVTKSPKMGTVGKVYGSYQSYIDPEYIMVGTNNKFVKTFAEPTMYGTQNSIAIELDNVAFIDSAKYEDNISFENLYNALGITRDSVALTVTFRVEIETVGGKTLYKDFEVVMPPQGFDISGSEFQTSFLTNDQTKMECFLEK